MATRQAHYHEVRGFARRRMSECHALGLFLIANFVTISLLSYRASDPSFNKTSEGSVHNMGGVVGAYLADLMLQTIGLASVLVIGALLAWSWRLFSKSHVRGWGLRISTLLFGLVGAATLCAYFDAPHSWPLVTGLGGSIGLLMHKALGGLITSWGLGILAMCITLASMPVAFGLRWREWVALSIILRRVFATMMLPLVYAKAMMRGSAEGLHSVPEEDEENERRPWWAFWRRAHEEEWDDEETEAEALGDEPQLEAVAEEAVAKPKKIVEKRKKKEEEEQKSFELRPMNEFQLPSYGLLNRVPARANKHQQSEASLSQNARLLESTLQDFGIKGEITKVRPGPVVTLYELEPSPGTKSSRVIGLADDIARSMSAVSARIAVIPGRNAIGIELPNATRETVYLREMFEDESYQNTEAKLPLALGKDIGGGSVMVDLSRMPHLLVAGTTGSGKSVAINTMILSLLYHLTPEQCRFIMIDPKMLELSVYDDIPHLLAPVVTEPGKAVVALKWAVKEMENRYRLMSNVSVRNIDSYNKRITDAKRKGEVLSRTVQTGFDHETGKPIMEKMALDMNPLPFIVVVVDEMADLMLVAGKDIESSIQRLAQMARAAGIHLIMATQRPSVDVITGVIKANFPTRISFQVTSKIDSRTILGEQGAEQLLGQGDMLYMAGGGRISRVHGPFVSDKEVEKIVGFLKEQGAPEYEEAVTHDEEAEQEMLGGGDDDDIDKELYDMAVSIVARDRKASTSYIQRKLKIGYNRAARLIEKMESDGLVGGANHVGKREVLMRAANE